MTTIPSHFKIDMRPKASSRVVVLAGKVRFSWLTPRIIRMEYSDTSQFEDRASQAFWYREQPEVDFDQHQSIGPDGTEILELENKYIKLVYKGGEFSPDNLFVEIKATKTEWHYGDDAPGNLGGTGRTLDGALGAIPIEKGLVSRDGWSVVDDSQALVFDENCWLMPRNAPAGKKDLYFFGFGRDYYGCLQDYTKVSGDVAMIPRWALGNWWSRYWEFSQDELTELMQDFQKHAIPLGVCIIDMDWHITKTGNECSGWTGYTWNRNLFPDPQGQLDWLHQQGLRVALNLHPAEGVHGHEDQYPEMARRMGIDPQSTQPVEFDISNPDFVKAYFEVLHHPQEEQGIDFWWMDWQQGTQSKVQGLDPLWWLNHLHFYDLGRGGKKRSFIFSRWGGLGNHRYPIGFSGDSVVCWESLAFQPYFTATASNVDYGWWSHDVGGHMGGVEDGEQYARWVQFGAFSPILRLHSTKNPFQDRRPWGYDEEVFKVAQEAMQLRHALIPYLYSMAWRFHAKSIPPILPMYYQHAEEEAAYACPNQYLYGDQLLVAPFTSPKEEHTQLTRQVVWLPKGGWYGFFDGTYYPEGWYPVYGKLEEIPVFAKAGAIVPLAKKSGWGGIANPELLDVYAFPGADGSFELYEDDGDSNYYLDGKYAVTRFEQTWNGDSQTLRIIPAVGDVDQVPASRGYDLHFRGIHEPKSVSLRVNGVLQKAAFRFCEDQHTLILDTIRLVPSDSLEVILVGNPSGLAFTVDPRKETLRKLIKKMRMETWVKTVIDENIDQLIEKPEEIMRARLHLSDQQIRALLETILGAGMERTKNHGGDLVVVWNNLGEERAVRTLNAFILTRWGHFSDLYLEKEKPGKTEIYLPGKDFGAHRWNLRLDLAGFFTEVEKEG